MDTNESILYELQNISGSLTLIEQRVEFIEIVLDSLKDGVNNIDAKLGDFKDDINHDIESIKKTVNTIEINTM